LFGSLTPSFHFRTIFVVEDNDADVSLLAMGLSKAKWPGNYSSPVTAVRRWSLLMKSTPALCPARIDRA
jgi:hypothetical protein